MKLDPGNSQVFPRHPGKDDKGLDLMTYVATAALQGILSGSDAQHLGDPVHYAVQYAKALCRRLEIEEKIHGN